MTYEHRRVGAGAGEVLTHDPNLAPQPHASRLLAHAVSTFVVALIAGLTIIGLTPRLFGFNSVVVTSGSMEPAIHAADIVITAPSDGVGLAPGSVINFEREDSTILHRISTVAENGHYNTAGDANSTPDSQIVAPEQVRGVGVVVVPLVGLPRIWADQGEWLYLATLAVGITAAMYMSRVRWVTKRPRWLT